MTTWMNDHREIAGWIAKTCEEVLRTDLDGEVPVLSICTGAGTAEICFDEFNTAQPGKARIKVS
jgi:fumarate hydratase class II